MPAEWTREGGVTTVTRYRYFRVDVMNMPSIENVSDAEIALMDDFDREELGEGGD